MDAAAAREAVPAIVDGIALVIEAIAVLVVAGAVARAVWRGAEVVLSGNRSYRGVRIGLVHPLVFALDLFVAADLIATVLAPTLHEVIIVAITAAVRIALGLALEHEVAAERREGETA